MKELRKELIDFASWLSEHRVNPAIHNIEALVSIYLKSINSEAGNEAPTVTDNEAKGKLCRHFQGCEIISCAKFICRGNHFNKCYEA